MGSAIIHIVKTPIEVGKVYELLEDHESGAVVVFVGRVRDTNEGRMVRSIVYEAFESMAVDECRRLWRETCERWDLRAGVLFHRVGDLAVGTISVAVGVAAPHRDAAFEAARFLIDALKDCVPIWKQEHYREGNHLWIGTP